MTHTIEAQLASAVAVANEAQHAYQSASLAVFDKEPGADKTLAKATAALTEANRAVSDIKAAQAGADNRATRQAEAEATAALQAEQAAARAHLEKITEAATAWDTALDGLVAATAAYEAIEAESHGVLSAEPLRKLTSARNSALDILGYRMHSFIGHQPAYFNESMARLVAHLPAVTPEV